MTSVGEEGAASPDRASQAHAFADAIGTAASGASDHEVTPSNGAHREWPRRTPRVSLIVVLPENHVVCPDRLAERLRAHQNKDVGVVVACAGQPTNLSALQRSVGHAQFILAPAGTSTEDLRELAMRQVPGDIVTLLSGSILPVATADAPMAMTS